MKNKETGKAGEYEAAQFLIAKGYEILQTNWRYRRSEIDIIAKQDSCLSFIEVKTRAYDYFGKPENFVTLRKKELMIDAATAYMSTFNYDGEIRFDIISIIMKDQQVISIEHFPDAFFFHTQIEKHIISPVFEIFIHKFKHGNFFLIRIGQFSMRIFSHIHLEYFGRGSAFSNLLYHWLNKSD